MKNKDIFSRNGTTFDCIMCNTIFFIPNKYIKEQRKVGCPICNKKKWKKTLYIRLFQ